MTRSTGKKSTSHRAWVRIPMTKGEGSLPPVPASVEGMHPVPLGICTFYLDPSSCEPLPSGTLVKRCRFLYNGINPVVHQGNLYGLLVEKGGWRGYPCPILEVELTAPSSPEDLLRVLRDSSVKIKDPDRDEVFFFEDWNGYSEMMSPSSMASWRRALSKALVAEGEFLPPEKMVEGILL